MYYFLQYWKSVEIFQNPAALTFNVLFWSWENRNDYQKMKLFLHLMFFGHLGAPERNYEANIDISSCKVYTMKLLANSYLLDISKMWSNISINLGRTPTWPCSPVPCRSTNASSLTAPEHVWATWSTERDPCFYLHFFHILITFLNCSVSHELQDSRRFFLWI